MIANVVGMGARSPLGLSALQVAMGLRAEIFEPRSLEMLDKHGVAMGMARVAGLGDMVHGYTRLVGLAAPAVAEAVYELPEELAPTEAEPLPLVVCVTDPRRPDHDLRYESQILADIAERSGVPVDLEKSSVISKSQAGFADAIAVAKALLDGGARAVIVGGVDTYYEPDLLRWLDDTFRLETVESEDGFIPSEGAGFMVLCQGFDAIRIGAIVDCGTGEENAVLDLEVPNVAEAMTTVVQGLVDRNGMPDWTIADINGEAERTREWLRVSDRVFNAGIQMDKWVWEMGDMGAATGPIYAVCIMKLVALGDAPASSALLALHADGPARCAVIVEGVVDGD